jgi:hypothetical protein
VGRTAGLAATQHLSQKAQKARLAKEAKLKALKPVPVSPEWIAAIQLYVHEVIPNDPMERARFDLLVGRAVAKNDMRILGKFFGMLLINVCTVTALPVVVAVTVIGVAYGRVSRGKGKVASAVCYRRRET